MATLSVLLITRNEEKKIKECLESIQDIADEIIVYDGNSTDKTQEISKEFGAKVIVDNNWEGFGKQRQKAEKFATKDFCLWIDADERVTKELKNEIKTFINDKQNSNSIMNISRANHICRIRIRHCGWYPDRVLRLYKNKYTTYNNNMVHEKLIIPQGSVIVNSKNDLIHYTYDTKEEALKKSQKYPQLWAENYWQKHQKGKGLPIAYLKALFKGFKIYILNLGFLDGKMGWFIAKLATKYTFNKYYCLYKIQKSSKLK